MDKDAQEHKKFLEVQLKWCRKQDSILEEIDIRLQKMKRIAEYTRDHELTSKEVDKLNDKLNDLKIEIHSLEEQLHSIVH
ncbi:hypothetical protein [Peribacillus deserti]|uniref:Uncharacterized protein n=1 Tax=Peribacillus deserti TaxID=673318 RepID=A0A2N5M9P5_9BACI|nr:hypothetical protein [Peribacillus deserti]PLT31072.1 hypothetical protein CUU66_04530 [Peribacillus deserti]